MNWLRKRLTGLSRLQGACGCRSYCFLFLAGAQYALEKEIYTKMIEHHIGIDAHVFTEKSIVDDVEFWAALLSGLLVGVCTGLFISKLTSRLIDLPLWTLVILGLYAVQQPLFAALTINDSLMATVAYLLTIMALYGKCLLLFVVEFARYRQRILYFMWRAPQFAEEERTRRL
jgi:hypothetical protein